MAFLTINGMTLPVSKGSVSVSDEEIGERGRAFDGTPYESLRSVKRSWTFKTTPLSQADAAAWRAVIRGVGGSWSFESDTYSAQGDALGIVGTVARVASGNKFGTYGLSIADTGSFAQFPVRSPTGRSTAVFWAGADYFWAVLSDNATYYLNGALYGQTPASFPNPTLLSVIGQRTIDDVWIVGDYLTAGMVAGLYAYGYAKPPLPYLSMSGDIGSSTVTGRVSGSKVVHGISGGSFASNMEELSVTLTEV